MIEEQAGGGKRERSPAVVRWLPTAGGLVGRQRHPPPPAAQGGQESSVRRVSRSDRERMD